MSRPILRATAGVIASQAAAAGPTIYGARFDGSSNYVTVAATDVYGAANARLFIAGIIRLPSASPAFSDADIVLASVTTNGRTRFLYAGSGNVLGWYLRGSSGGVTDGYTTGAHGLSTTFADNLDKDIAYIIECVVNGGSAVNYSGTIKVGAADAVSFNTIGTPTTGSTTLLAYNGLVLGGNYNGSALCPIIFGPLWMTTGIAPLAVGGEAALDVFQDFFGAGSHLAATDAVPQWTGGNGAFTGGTTAVSFAQPALMIDWEDLTNNGSSGGTVTATGSPTYGLFSALT